MAEATQTKERPILFNAAMVRAVLDGSKTQTRRVMKPQPNEEPISIGLGHPEIVVNGELEPGAPVYAAWGDEWNIESPFGQPGDQLWVREGVWCYEHTGWGKNNQLKWPKMDMAAGLRWFDASCEFEADNPTPMHDPIGRLNKMLAPRWASRILLEVTDVRVERVQEISADDAEMEGLEMFDSMTCSGDVVQFYQTADGDICDSCPRSAFADLWDSLAKPGERWADNPFVWAVSFKRLESPHA